MSNNVWLRVSSFFFWSSILFIVLLFFVRFTWAVGFFSSVYYVLYYFYFIHKPNERLCTRDEKPEREKKLYSLCTVQSPRIISLVRGIRTVKHNGLPKRNAVRTRRSSRYIPGIYRDHGISYIIILNSLLYIPTYIHR